MASRPTHARPLSPHLTVWKWGPHMLVSIVHRATGTGMATVGALLMVWWLAALAGGAAYYDQFRDVFTYADGGLNAIGWILAVGLSWSVFQHMSSGVRHLVLDTGAGFELKRNKTGAVLTFVCSILLTLAFWGYIIGVKAHG